MRLDPVRNDVFPDSGGKRLTYRRNERSAKGDLPLEMIDPVLGASSGCIAFLETSLIGE
jgi:hypothetical protein